MDRINICAKWNFVQKETILKQDEEYTDFKCCVNVQFLYDDLCRHKVRYPNKMCCIFQPEVEWRPQKR